MIMFGQESSIWLARALAPSADVHLFAPERVAGYAAGELRPEVEIRPFAWPRVYHPLAQLRAARALVARIHSLDPDVVHLHQGNHMLNLLLRGLGAFPLVVTVHEPSLRHRARHAHRRPPEFTIGMAFRRADRVIVYSEVSRGPVVGRGVAEELIHVIPRATPAAVDGTADRQTGATILFFGTVFPYKGLEDLIQAVPAVARAIPEVTLVVAGQGIGHDRYRRLAAGSPQVRFEQRFVPRVERDELFRRASVVVLPYLDATTSGVVPVAQLFAKPVVATDVGGLGEQIGGGGVVVPAGDGGALAQALVGLLNDEALRERLGAEGRRKLERESAPEHVAAQTLAVYDLARARAYT
jgi:glycosyltransferase involved in cell wall biosynthesis